MPPSDLRPSGGPRLGPWQPLPARDEPYGPAAAGGRYLLTANEDGFTRVVSIALDGSGPDRDLARVPGDVAGVYCAARAPTFCAVHSLRVDEAISFSDSHASQIPESDLRLMYLVDGDPPAQRPLAGPWRERADLALPAPVAPDGSFVVVEELRKTGQRESDLRARLHFVTRGGQPAAHADVAGLPAELIGWRGQGPSLRAVVRAGAAEKEEPDHFEIDPRSGELRPIPGTPEEEVSPDGRHRVTCREGREIVIAERSTGRERRFPVHADDQPLIEDWCATWASPRYLTYVGVSVAGFLDIESMKVNDGLGVDAQAGDLEYTSDFRFAILNPAEGRPRFARILEPRPVERAPHLRPPKPSWRGPHANTHDRR